MIPVLIILTVISGLFTVIYYQKYSKLKKGLKSYEAIGTERFGFYKVDCGNYSSYVYIKEIDRYTDGYSKIKIDCIEPFHKQDYGDAATRHAMGKFLSLMKTTDIEWLESEDHIRKVRKEKLENLKKV